MKKILGISLLLIMFAACSSNTKEDYIEEFTEFTEDVISNHADYTEEDWNVAIEQFKELSSKFKYYRDDMSLDDIKKVNNLKRLFMRQSRQRNK